MSSEVTAELIEEVFGKHSDSVRFANFCNSVVIAENSASAPSIPILSEKPGADGGMDGELASTQEHSMRALFNALGKASRDRFLERMVTVDLSEKSTFWDFMFGENGPLETGRQIAESFDHLDCLARAVPARTARFLEVKLNDQSSGAWIS